MHLFLVIVCVLSAPFNTAECDSTVAFLNAFTLSHLTTHVQYSLKYINSSHKEGIFQNVIKRQM